MHQPLGLVPMTNSHSDFISVEEHFGVGTEVINPNQDPNRSVYYNFGAANSYF
ncbi:unnamed protein product [Cuscuta epithymum]|nr:unnamed protein product [Cuscuta epithymum]